MCSDGLSDMLDDTSIAQVLQMHESLAGAGTALIDAANDAGGKDNISRDSGARRRRRAVDGAIVVALPDADAHGGSTAARGQAWASWSFRSTVWSSRKSRSPRTRPRSGRRPYNDIVIDNLAVSGEHAVLQMVGTDVFIEDLNSTNGTYINGKAIKKQLLAHNDTVEIGKYKIKYLIDDSADYEKTMIMRPGRRGASRRPCSPSQPPSSGFGGARRQRRQPGVDQGAQRRRRRAAR